MVNIKKIILFLKPNISWKLWIASWITGIIIGLFTFPYIVKFPPIAWVRSILPWTK